MRHSCKNQIIQKNPQRNLAKLIAIAAAIKHYVSKENQIKKKSLREIPRSYGKCRLLVPKKSLQPTDLLFPHHHHLLCTPQKEKFPIKAIRSLHQLKKGKKKQSPKLNGTFELYCVL